MSAERESTVAFDVLLKAAAGDVPASAETIEQLRPAPADIESCVRWLSRHGVECHRTGFGIACEMPTKDFEKLFGVKVGGRRARQPGQEIAIPDELARTVEQITITPRPEMFG
jgi:hypothetical protein